MRKDIILKSVRKGSAAMAEEKGWKSVTFGDDKYSFLKIASIGYRDYSVCKRGDFVAANRWHSLYFVQGGSGSFTVNGKKYALEKGDLFFIRPGEPVAYCTDDDTLKYYWIAFFPEHAEEIAEILGLSQEKPVRHTKFAQRIEWIFSSVIEWDKGTSRSYFAAISALMQILSAECEVEELPYSVEKHKALAESIKQTIDLNFKNPDFSVNDAAQLLYISHSTMSRVFKETMGITPVAYLIDVRLGFAAELLLEQDISVKELSVAAGFYDSGYFMKRFKKKFGMTVKEYRIRHSAERFSETKSIKA